MYKLKIEKMHCMSCFRNIEDALKEFDSSISLQAEIEQRTLAVETEASIDQIKEVVEEAGYPVGEAQKVS